MAQPDYQPCILCGKDLMMLTKHDPVICWYCNEQVLKMRLRTRSLIAEAMQGEQ